MKLRGEFPKLRLGSVNSLALWLGIDKSEMLALADNVDPHYHPTTVPKDDGSERIIDRPTGPVKELQARINSRILSTCPVSEMAFGGVKGRDHIRSARHHQRKAWLATLDIKSFFPSITNKHVYDLFDTMGCAPDVARVLTMLLTFRGHLPQGSPASTTVANLLLSGFDAELLRRAGAHEAAITRFIDDVPISGNREQVAACLDLAIRRLNGLGLRVNRKKLRFTPSSQEHVVHKLNVNGDVSIPRKYRLAVRSRVRAAVKFGISDAERRSLVGKIRYIARANPDDARRLMQALGSARSTESLSA